MLRTRVSLVLLAFVASTGCGQNEDAPVPPAVPTAPTPAAPAPVAAPTAAPTGGGQCIVGAWQANDFLAMVRGQMRRGMAGDAQLTRAGGTIRMEFDAPGPDGSGTARAIADDLRHTARATQQGFTITATHTMTGEAMMPFRLPGDGTLILDEADESTLAARVSIRASGGMKLNRGSRPRVDLSGEYAYECEGDSLRVWEVRNGERRGNPMAFERAQDS